MPAKHRFATLISLLLIVGFLATSLVSYTVSVTLLKRGLSESILPLTGDNIYSEIQKDLVRPIFIASMMASDTFLRDWVLAGEQDVGRMTRYLAEVKSKYQTITSFFVSDRSYIYYHAEGILKQVSPEEPRDVWYYRVRSMDAPYELNVDRDMANRDAMTIFINHQVHDYDGNYIGATGCGLSVSSVTQLLAAYEQRYRRHIFFVDAKGMVTFSANNDRLPTILDQIEGLREIAPTILKQEHGSFSYERDGQTFIVDTRYVKELGWYLLVEQSLAPEMEMLRRTLLINLALGLIIGLIILVVVQRTISHYQCRLERLATSDKTDRPLQPPLRRDTVPTGVERGDPQRIGSLGHSPRYRSFQSDQRPLWPSSWRPGTHRLQPADPVLFARVRHRLPLGWGGILGGTEMLQSRRSLAARGKDPNHD